MFNHKLTRVYGLLFAPPSSLMSCTFEFNDPDLAYLCTHEGTCCDPEGCECGVYKLIEYGESCQME